MPAMHSCIRIDKIFTLLFKKDLFEPLNYGYLHTKAVSHCKSYQQLIQFTLTKEINQLTAA